MEIPSQALRGVRRTVAEVEAALRRDAARLGADAVVEVSIRLRWGLLACSATATGLAVRTDGDGH